jgi:hypothetical protein
MVKELRFESGISVYGQVGFADIILEEDFDKNIYKMTTITSSTGIVKVLTGNRSDTFISEGIIKEGIYIPQKFTKRTAKTDYEKVITYIFDYKKNTVAKEKITKKYETVSKFDPVSFEFIQSKKLLTDKVNENIKLCENDFLTLYLNLKHGNLKTGNVVYIDQDDEDSISLVNESLFEIEKDNGNEKYRIVLIDDKESIFFYKAVAENIAFYGDAYIKKISEKNKIIH